MCKFFFADTNFVYPALRVFPRATSPHYVKKLTVPHAKKLAGNKMHF